MVIRALGVFVCLATLLPVFRSKRWWVRLCDFPRVQICALGLGLLGAGSLRRKSPAPFDNALRFLLGASATAQLLQIARYTPLVPKQTIRAKKPQAENTVKLLVANLLMSNRASDRMLKRIRDVRPDIVLLLEPDKWWQRQLKVLERTYEHTIMQPLDNTYGMLMYSKLPLVESEVRFLLQRDIPSIKTRIQLPNGRRFWFYGMHPKPPGLIDRRGEIRGSGPRDAELILLAKEIQNLRDPVIVAGDFNDVAWSHTTRRFQRLARVLDPRVGRGFYNTFHAQYRLLRFPLDHLFHSEHFALVSFERQSDVGSDHFPICVTLSLEPVAEQEQEPPPADLEDHIDAEEDLQEERERRANA